MVFFPQFSSSNCIEIFIQDADSALAHGADVKDLMKEPVEV